MIVSLIIIISLKRNILVLKVLEAHNFKIKITLKLKKKKKNLSKSLHCYYGSQTAIDS